MQISCEFAPIATHLHALGRCIEMRSPKVLVVFVVAHCGEVGIVFCMFRLPMLGISYISNRVVCE